MYRNKVDIVSGDVAEGCGEPDIVISTRLGGGASGEVWRGTCSGDSRTVAVKIMTDSNVGGGSKVAVLVAQLVKDFAPEAIRCCILRGHECLIFPVYAMDLRRVLSTGYLLPFPSEQSMSIIWQLLSGVYYLHEIGITHADIKPENILLVDGKTVDISRLQDDGTFENKMVLKSCEIKIGDLDDTRLPRQKAYYPAGSDCYRSPEILAGVEWTNKVDIFSVGCVTYELLAGRLLFPEQKDSKVKDPFIGQSTQDGNVNVSPWVGISERTGVSFIKAATTRNYKRRPSALALLHHKYFGELAGIYKD
ncbi:hypothetical protein CVT26_013209 [Gymnopilus dilepis]|uniref:Protein kinase domain-containing protein n=1 Tax=Gymnopilus dilepis TaxID=231916 RepID=A0A409WV34_9AGAR|nr:hypothetical protein CVT26_013209 [Gymnopilus dilepis]